MNIKNYAVNNDSTEIFITVTVSTPGIATSDAEITVGGKNIKIASSSGGSGLIAKTSLGKSSDIINGLIEIDTDIELDLVPSSEWQSCYDNLVIKYYFDGGVDNTNQPFICEAIDKHKSVSGKTIGAEKYVLLISKT
jgi:hypothetical protein